MIYGALGDRQPSVFAVTGNPVPFYFRMDFFGKEFRRLRQSFSAKAFSR
jgi:hypothetical protein